MTDQTPKKSIKRECGSCTECCQGWLVGKVHEHNFYPGKPCHYVCEEGCSIYEDRPERPCRSFECEWLVNDNIPEWMRPDRCKVILICQDWEYEGESQGPYLLSVEAGQKIDSKVLAWLFEVHLNDNIPMKIEVSGGHRWYGNKKFLEFSEKS